MVRVAIVEPVGGHGGMHFYDFGLAEGLAAAGVQVTLYTCDETEQPVATSPGREFGFRRPFNGIYGKAPKPVRFLRYIAGLVRALADARRNGATIVHFHFFHATLLERISLRLARVFGLHIVVTAHDIESFAGAGSVKEQAKLYRSLENIIVHNAVSKDELVSRLGVSAERVHTIKHGNYLGQIRQDLQQSLCRQRLALPSNKKIILFFGQIKKVKGLDLLVQALPKVLEKHRDILLLVAGKVWKDDFSSYADEIEKNDLQDYVRCDIRYIPDAEVDYYYRASDIVVLPYRKIYQSGVLLMAMSYGLPVIASNLRGMSEVIIDGSNGSLFAAGDSDDLAMKLGRALDEPKMAEEMAARGYEHVRAHYSWETIGEDTRDVYQGILNERRS